MDPRILLFIHEHASPFLDHLARVSHAMGTQTACLVLVLAAVVTHGLRGQRREAMAWIVTGLATAGLILGLKAVVMRPRPRLWPYLVPQGGSSFPSGHAIASAAFYPLLAWVVARRRPRLLPGAFVLAAGLSLFVGLGRLYLGMHWPTDVVAGWLLGAALSSSAIAWLRSKERRGARTANPEQSDPNA